MWWLREELVRNERKTGEQDLCTGTMADLHPCSQSAVIVGIVVVDIEIHVHQLACHSA